MLRFGCHISDVSVVDMVLLVFGVGDGDVRVIIGVILGGLGAISFSFSAGGDGVSCGMTW